MSRSHWLIPAVLLVFGLWPGTALAGDAGGPAEGDSLSALIDMLAEKGVLSAEEVDELKGRVAEAKKPAPPAEEPEYPTFKAKVRLEARFSDVQGDENQPFFGHLDDREAYDGFNLRRARLYLYGDLNPDVGYKVQYRSDWNMTSNELHVAEMQWRRWDLADVVVGQLQTPFGYEIMLTDAYLLCTDRASASTFLPPDKDIGIRLDGKQPVLGGLDYQLYLGNGDGKHVANAGGYLWAARVTAEPSPTLSVGASYASNDDTAYSPYQKKFLGKNADPYNLLPAYAAAEVDETSWEVDAQWHNGATSVWAEYISADIDPESGSTVTSDGYYVDLHHFLPYRGRRDKLEVVAGYQEFDGNTEVTDQFDLTAYTLGLNYHVRGSRYGKQRCQDMIRLNYIWSREAVDEVDNDKLVIQYQTWY